MFLHDYLLACEISPRFDINLLLLENMRPVLHLSPVFPTLKYFFLRNLCGQPILIFFTSGTEIKCVENILLYSWIFYRQPSKVHDECIEN